MRWSSGWNQSSVSLQPSFWSSDIPFKEGFVPLSLLRCVLYLHCFIRSITHLICHYRVYRDWRAFQSLPWHKHSNKHFQTALVETGPDCKHISRHGWPKTTFHRDFMGLSRFDSYNVRSYLFMFHRGRILSKYLSISTVWQHHQCCVCLPFTEESLCWFSCVIFMRIKPLCSLSVRSCVVQDL